MNILISISSFPILCIVVARQTKFVFDNMASPDPPLLSHDFLELYRSYKRKTQKIITWLQETCEIESITVKTLIAAAESVRNQKIDVPSDLYYVFKDALALRVAVAQQYKQVRLQGPDQGRQESIEKHDYFIER